jgi:hypothetical protein
MSGGLNAGHKYFRPRAGREEKKAPARIADRINPAMRGTPTAGSPLRFDMHGYIGYLIRFPASGLSEL